MARDKPVYGDRWSESSLERAGRLGEKVYLKTLSRKVTWPPVKETFYPQEEGCENISFDEAFAAVSDYLNQVSLQCKKYHVNRVHTKGFEGSVEHCERCHRKPLPAQRHYTGNVLQTEEAVHLTLPQGAYAVTAHNPGTGAKKTNIVEVGNKGGCTLHFTV